MALFNDQDAHRGGPWGHLNPSLADHRVCVVGNRVDKINLKGVLILNAYEEGK